MKANIQANRLQLLSVLTVLLLGFVVATTAGAEEETVKKIRIKKVVGGDGGEHRMVVIGEDGEQIEVTGEGHHWVSANDGGPFAFAFGHGGPDHKGGFLGVGMTELTPELLEHFGVAAEAGVMVSRVVEDSPAYLAGIRVGDIITTVDGELVTSGHALARTIGGHAGGETVALEVWRDGSPMNFTTALEKREDSMKIAHHMAHKAAHKIVVACDDDEEDCDVEVECEDGTCTCTVDGEATECGELGGAHVLHGE